MVRSKDGKVAKNIEKELAKHARPEERAIKKLFDERWQAMPCVEQDNAFHVTFKTNEMNAY